MGDVVFLELERLKRRHDVSVRQLANVWFTTRIRYYDNESPAMTWTMMRRMHWH
jgi:hypothetical protein